MRIRRQLSRPASISNGFTLKNIKGSWKHGPFYFIILSCIQKLKFLTVY